MENIEPITMHYLRKSLIFFLLLLFIEFSSGKHTLSTGETLKDKDGDSLISAKKTFILKFFSPGMSANRYLGIWNYGISDNKVVWVANRDSPMMDTSGIVSFHMLNKLAIYGSNKKEPIWATSFLGSGKNYSAQLMDTGNLVVFEEEKKGVIAWQSFDHPTNIWLPEMKLGVNWKTGLNWSITSWKSNSDPRNGEYSLRMNIIREFSELSIYSGSNQIWRSGPLNGAYLGEMTHMKIFNVTYVDNEDGIYMTYHNRAPSAFSIMELAEGMIVMFEWSPNMRNWTVVWALPSETCDFYNSCGPNNYCVTLSRAVQDGCSCFPGFELKKKGKMGVGCVRKRNSNICQNGEGFVKLSSMKMPDTSTARVDTTRGSKECEKECLRECNCTAYANSTAMGFTCVMWYGNLFDARKYESGGQDLFVRVDAGELALNKTQQLHYSSSNKKPTVAIVATSVSVGVVAAFIAIFKLYTRKQGLRSTAPQEPAANSWTKEVFDANETNGNIQFIDLTTLIEATNNFCDQHKLGRGGFGTVYKGILKDGYVIAVKRLSETSQQGVAEFKNEATLVSRLQHMNLVRLLGCCAEQNEKNLIYEYMPNKSLDSLIFDPEKSSCLDWEQRFNIIMGIIRGMIYLHNDSRLKIIHRDLKASNILLDARMNPKVSDFGMARFFDNGEVEAITRTVVGTYGYMSPEYISKGIYSTKSDVFSFGVLLLEIISGRKNNAYINEETMNLVALTWDLGEHALEIVDSSMGDYPAKTVQRCIRVGLLCVQQNADHRPTMSEIFVMLSSEEIELPTPRLPGFFHRLPPRGYSSSNDYTSSSDYMSSSRDYIASSSDTRNDLTCSEIIPR